MATRTIANEDKEEEYKDYGEDGEQDDDGDDDDDDDDDEDAEDDFRDDDDDDDDDYDEEYDEDNENDDDHDLPYLDGILLYDNTAKKLVYKGSSFHMESVMEIPYNLLDNSYKPSPENKMTFEMVGPCDLTTSEVSGRKPTPRKIMFSITLADPNDIENGRIFKGRKTDGDDDDDAKRPSIFYHVNGSEDDNPEDGIELEGGFAPVSGGKEVSLICAVRSTNKSKVSTHATAPSAVAATARKGRMIDDDDNIDDVDEDGIDHNELIALHEEARLSTDALRKRYRSGERSSIYHGPNDQGDDDGNGAVHVRKKSLPEETKYKLNSNDDDDDDLEF